MNDVLQVIGAVLILVPFAWQQLGTLSTDRLAYLWPNVLGSGLLAYIAFDGQQWGFLLLEVVWALVALRGLVVRGPDRAALHH
jgi:hypothetical protein